MTDNRATATSGFDINELTDQFAALRTEIGKVIVGQDAIIHQVFICLLCKGHALLVGVPGLAKTLLIKTLAEAIELSFNRIQFTPDLMPSDITGTEIIEEDVQTGRRAFKFVQGPVFANVILADEINRTPPKTQAALLEAMQERHVTASGNTFKLDLPFFVLATQNPIEHEGTYPLPEAQLDRFMFNLWLDYPSFDEEVDIVRNTTTATESDVRPVMSADALRAFQVLVRQLPATDDVIEYAVSLVNMSRPGRSNAPAFVSEYLSYGAGPRASQYLILGAKARAALDGRLAPTSEDGNEVAIPVMRHRIVPNFNADAEGVTAVDLIGQLLAHQVDMRQALAR
ncbi:MAG: MoxR family ATPase, partial [Rhodothermales bacterium]|nr:MoxR family ATPase [Rhodothermales bacterium]